jgi:MFS family permease
VGLTNVIFTVVAMLLIDRLGRKPLLIAGLSGIIVSMSLVSYGFGQATYTLTNDSISSIELDVQTKAPLGALVGTRFESDVAFKTAIGDALGEQVARDNQSTIIASAISVNALLVLVGILGFVASFAVSLGPVMWVLFSEVFPNRIRGIAIGVATVFNSSASFLVQFLFPWQINALGTSTTFALFALVGAVGMMLIWRLPETKGESLERLEQKLA